MTARKLAEKLLEHPDYDVYVGVERRLFGDIVYGFDHIEDKTINVDDNMARFYLGEYN